MSNEKDDTIKKYDNRGNVIYIKYHNGLEEWAKYDENNNCIYYKDYNKVECWHEYDENNNNIHSKNSNGFEVWKEYDENGNCIHSKNSNGYEEWFEYNKHNDIIKHTDSNYNEELYDKNGNLIYFINIKAKTEYDEYYNNPMPTNNNNTKYELTEEEYKEYIILKTYFEKLQKAVNDITKELYSDIQ